MEQQQHQNQSSGLIKAIIFVIQQTDRHCSPRNHCSVVAGCDTSSTVFFLRCLCDNSVVAALLHRFLNGAQSCHDRKSGMSQPVSARHSQLIKRGIIDRNPSSSTGGPGYRLPLANTVSCTEDLAQSSLGRLVCFLVECSNRQTGRSDPEEDTRRTSRQQAKSRASVCECAHVRAGLVTSNTVQIPYAPPLPYPLAALSRTDLDVFDRVTTHPVTVNDNLHDHANM